MPKIIPLGQKLWPTGRGHTDTHTDRQTDRESKHWEPLFSKKNFLIFFFFKKERSNNSRAFNTCIHALPVLKGGKTETQEKCNASFPGRERTHSKCFLLCLSYAFESFLLCFFRLTYFFCIFQANLCRKKSHARRACSKKITCAAEKSHACVHVNQRNYQRCKDQSFFFYFVTETFDGLPNFGFLAGKMCLLGFGRWGGRGAAM